MESEVDRLAKITDEMCDTIHGLEIRAEAAESKLAAIVMMLEPGSGQLGYIEDERTMSLTVAEWNILEQAHARAVAIAEGLE